MRRLFVIFAAVVLLLSLSVSVSAATGATQVTVQSTVATDEGCDVILTANFHLDQAVPNLTFPIPAKASTVTLNGSRVGTSLKGDLRLVDLSGITGNMAGDFSIVLTYHLNDVVSRNPEGVLMLEVPLLSGFDYPVKKFSATIMIPGEIAADPSFTSGYHHTNIEQDLDITAEGATITCNTRKELKDHETLAMTMVASELMFPQSVLRLQNMEPLYVLMGVFGGIAIAYWIIFLRNKPPRFLTLAQPLDGFSAGQVSSVISLRGADLTLMVFSWAQLGYLLIQEDRRGRILLHKRMEMGNERSFFEQKCFHNLFGSRPTVDASSLRYALYCQKVSRIPPNIQGLVHPNSGSFLPMRLFMALVGVMDGICIGLTLSVEAALPWVAATFFGILCGIASWFIHLWSDSFVSSRKGRFYVAVLFMGLWLGLSLYTGTFALDGWILLAQILASLLVTFGGRRTAAGHQAMSEMLGLHRYLRQIPRTQVVHLCQNNPDYFHDLAPYAIALGVDSSFASRFGKRPQPPCPYLITPTSGRLTAAQWVDVMRRVMRRMNVRMQQLPLDNVLATVQRFTKQ